jgi:hypothetical protein
MNKRERGGSIEDLKLRGKGEGERSVLLRPGYRYGPDTVWA